MSWKQRALQQLAAGNTPAALLEVIAEVERLQARRVQDDFQTAATSDDVCICSYKPFPHSRLPLHLDAPKGS